MLDLESLLSPLSDDAPSGPDLEYDPAFLALQEAGAGKAEQQYGDTVIPAEPPDWRAVHEQALELAQRTRDVRVGVWLVRAGARLQGWGAAVQGLQYVAQLLERHWASVHPQLDASDNNDPTMRLNALAPLGAQSDGLADLRAAAVTGQRGGLTVRDVELAFGGDEPLAGESQPTEAGVLQALEGALAQMPDLPELMRSGLTAVKAMAGTVEQQVSSGQGPEFDGLLKLVRTLAAAADRLGGAAGAAGEAGEGGAAEGGAGAAAARAVPVGSIASREDAVKALDRVCEWIERNEPSNPAPLLIRRAQRLMSKNFMDIIRDLVPEGLDQIEKLAGTSGESQ